MLRSNSPSDQDRLEVDIQGAVVCCACDSAYAVDERRLSCLNCGATLQLADEPALRKRRRNVGTYMFLQPVAKLVDARLKSVGMLLDAGGPSLREQLAGEVMCGWCGKQQRRRPDEPNCDACGGVLPLPASSDPGPPPPAASRELPPGFAWRVYVTQNLGGWFGLLLIFVSFLMICAMGPLALVVFLFGFASAHSNFLTGYRKLRALRLGTPVVGKIESVQMIGDPSDSIPMFRIYFRFDVGGASLRGMKTTYDKSIATSFVGQPVWVVCLPHAPACHDLWPPLA